MPPRKPTSRAAPKPAKAPAGKGTPKPAKTTRRAKAKPPPPRRAAKRAAKPAKTRPKSKVDLAALGATVVSLSGKTVLIQMPSEEAEQFFPEPLEASGSSDVTEGVERQIATIRRKHRAIANSGLAASAIALAREIDSPLNTATAKAACAKEMREVLGVLRGLAPEEKSADNLDKLKGTRTKRRAGGAETPR